MPKNISFSVRLDSKLKADAEKLFAELGLSLGSAMNIFLRQSVRVKGLPFSIRLRHSEKPDDEKKNDE
jgi:DNA-damage-inducible protein J